MQLAQYKQALRGVDVQPVQDLLALSPVPSLVAWYGDPMTQPAAEALCARAQRELQLRLCAGGERFPLHVVQLICHFWMGAATRVESAQLGILARTERDSAFLHLCYGQLLISSKIRLAMQYLAQGFSLAVPYLEPTEYFSLVRQHELLAYLRLADTPSPPWPLQNLLAEAAVIRRLQKNDRPRMWDTHVDTLG